MSKENQEIQKDFNAYVIGFSLSIILTIIPLVLVLYGMLDKTMLIIAILLAASLQFLVQIYYFMHLKENKNRGYILITLAVGIIIAVTVVGGSAWVMNF
ncbi:cytochrome C oxidase subunit IV family protein [Aquibacillus sp. 3ASR75-11]|uniref:Cytochrome C oxidase subunit IV family protein n=1 Tax=Terrihalobacillus insolitus TaxID=2950438 RepID=A0A9X4AMW0_9BACI|nr:cytochrome C oxidase subunit IV family protein [Terrihalobacillus insolitus]MDC3425857.1 cytochrome C oxidase subunit IV family protein [Terrihalobacillus insolitus]